ncbi:MAG: hypothetical protein ACLP8S_21510 [Solirubrobacteraceae bacterium]
MAASHLPRGSRSRPRSRPRGCRNDQTHQPSVLRTAGQHLRAVGGEGPRQLFLYDGAIVTDPAGIITGGHENKSARTLSIRQGEHINAPALTAMFKQIIANNRAGGWRKLKREVESAE